MACSHIALMGQGLGTILYRSFHTGISAVSVPKTNCNVLKKELMRHKNAIGSSPCTGTCTA